jgi:hydroxymethylglutaryl-CoA lyase
MTEMPDVILNECFARDGLQHEPTVLPAAGKAAMLERIADCGFRRIEITSFSHPKYVPQFADAVEVLDAVPPRPGVLFKATCPNPAAVQRALATRDARPPEEISFLVSASEGHTQRNLRRSRAEQWRNVGEMAALAGDAFTTVGTISVAFDCPFDGPISPARVVEDAQRYLALGVKRIAVGDTIGSATPPRVRELMRLLQAELPQDAVIIAHFHDSRGTGLANCVAALEAGITYFDTALGGTGGHPAEIAYGEGFTGNVCTEDLATLFEAMGLRTGLDITRLRNTGRAAEALLGRRLHARTTRLGEHA